MPSAASAQFRAEAGGQGPSIVGVEPGELGHDQIVTREREGVTGDGR
jgi:hypothetical protein